MENSTNEMIEMTVKVVLCDIEGTTTSISFVKDTLFPYAKQHVEQFLQDNWDNEQVKNIVSEIRKQSKSDEETKVDGLVAIKSGESDAKDEQIKDVVANLQWQISIDRKTGGLKELQGLIWKKGYEQKTLSGHVYDDVAEAFKKWTTDGLKIYIYSSGSVEAQKLLFGHSEAGDLLSFLSGHFDTKIGHKQETDSYKNILKELNLSGTDVLFLTDVVKEAEAAVNAEMKAIILDRPGNADLTSEDREKYKVAKSFAELKLLANLGLKRKLEAAEGSEQIEVQATKIAKIEEDSNIKAEDKVDNVVTPAVNDVADQKMEDEEMKSVEPIKNSESDDKEKAKEEISEDPKSPDVPNENTKTDDTNSNDILKADEQTESEKTEILDEDSLLNEKTVETEESKNENESTKLNGNEPKIEELETIEKDIEMEEGKISPDQCAEPIVKEPEEKVITKPIEPERLTENIESPEEEEILNKTETVENGESKGDENNSDKTTPIDALCPDETTEADESFLLSDPMKNMEEAEVEKTNGNGTEDNKEMKEDKSIVEAKSVKAEEEAITNLPTKKCSDLSMADSSTIPTNPAIAVEAEN